MIKQLPHPKSWLLKQGLKPKKSFSQNFLIDDAYLLDISYAVADFCESDTLVIEYAAGMGALTHSLLNQNLKVHAIEIDRDLIPYLTKYFATNILNQNLFVHRADVKKFDLLSLYKHNNSIVLCGNLPYHLSSSLIELTIMHYSKIKGAVFLLQKELVNRLIASPDCKSYGVLSVLFQVRFSLRKIFDVPRTAFWPIPNIDSSVIVLSTKKIENNFDIDWLLFKSIVKTAFLKRRKIVRNSLSFFSGIEIILNQLGLDHNLRAENLTVKNFIDISKKLFIEKNHA